MNQVRPTSAVRHLAQRREDRASLARPGPGRGPVDRCHRGLGPSIVRRHARRTGVAPGFEAPPDPRRSDARETSTETGVRRSAAHSRLLARPRPRDRPAREGSRAQSQFQSRDEHASWRGTASRTPLHARRGRGWSASAKTAAEVPPLTDGRT